MSVKEILFDGVKAFEMTNGRMSARILSYGATIQSLCVDGLNVVCGYDDMRSYREGDGYLGATVGRYANRIAGGKFSLGGKKYVLNCNEKGVTHLHGGICGFDKRIWNARKAGDSVIMSLFSPDGEEGYPGNLTVALTFVLGESALIINYRALCDTDTVLNLTNHSYFNLNGAGNGTIDNHLLTINASTYDAVDNLLIPVSASPVKNTPFDFRREKTIGRDIACENEQLALGGGYDHNFRIRGSGYRHAASLCGDRTGTRMNLYTDMPCMQLYTGNFLGDSLLLSGNKAKVNRGAVCLETQCAPNSPNRSSSATLKSGEVYNRTALFEFI